MKHRLALFLISVSLFILPSFAHAGTENNMAGWAWSDDTGWISFNCTNTNTCGTVDYGVSDNSGTLTGYAWSDSVGWIQFGGLSGFPSGSGTSAVNAQMSGSNLIGWAKAIGADNAGWDGWISLSGSNYGITLAGSSFSGYAWDSGVDGWVSFSAAGANGVVLSSSAALDAQAPLGTSIANNGNVPYGTVANLVYTLTNLSGATCTLSKTSSGGTAFTTVTGITTSGSASTQGLTTGGYTFNITCISGGSTVASTNVSFTVGSQPAGFSLGPDDTIKISFLPAGLSQSETKTITVNAVGGFSGNVTVSISSYPTMPNASTTAMYSVNGGAYANTMTPVIIGPNGSFTFKVEVSFKVGASASLMATYCSGNPNPCTITLQGTASGVSSEVKNLFITPTIFNPQFQEI